MKHTATIEAAISAADGDALAAFYIENLGFTFLSKTDVPSDMAKPTGISETGYAVIRLQNDRGNLLKILCSDQDRPAHATPKTVSHRHGYAYVTLSIDDLDGCFAQLLAKDVSIHSDGVVPIKPGRKLLFLRDPEGNFVELVEDDSFAE